MMPPDASPDPPAAAPTTPDAPASAPRASASSNPVAGEVARKAQRKLRARGEQRLGVWFGLGMFGIIGWAVAVPTVIGVLIGTWLDANAPAGFSWVLTLLMAGLITGCLNAWWWLTRSHSAQSSQGNQQHDDE